MCPPISHLNADGQDAVEVHHFPNQITHSLQAVLGREEQNEVTLRRCSVFRHLMSNEFLHGVHPLFNQSRTCGDVCAV